MYRFDMHCRKCGYEGEQILNHHSDKKDCPVCSSQLEKAAGGFNISIGQSKPQDTPREISTPMGRAEHIGSIEISSQNFGIRADIYETREARLGDPEMN